MQHGTIENLLGWGRGYFKQCHLGLHAGIGNGAFWPAVYKGRVREGKLADIEMVEIHPKAALQSLGVFDPRIASRW